METISLVVKYFVFIFFIFISTPAQSYNLTFLDLKMKQVLKINLEKNNYFITEGTTEEWGKAMPCHKNLLAAFFNAQVKSQDCPVKQRIGFLQADFGKQQGSQQVAWCASESISLNRLLAAFNKCK